MQPHQPSLGPFPGLPGLGQRSDPWPLSLESHHWPGLSFLLPAALGLRGGQWDPPGLSPCKPDLAPP